MRSGLEIFLTDAMYRLRDRLRRRDRAVVIGAVLSFCPIFPACLVGLLISGVNYVLIHRGITRASDQRLVEISLIVSVIFSSVWLTVIYAYGQVVFGGLVDLLMAPWAIFDILLSPPNGPTPIPV